MSTIISTPLSSIVGDSKQRAETAGAGSAVFLKILAAVDDSAQAKWAIEVAMRLVKSCSGKLSLVHVSTFPIAWTADAELWPEDLCKPDAENDTVLQDASRSIPSDLLGERILRYGDASHQIVEVARSRNADLLVLGTHGRNLATRLLLGGTAESVVRHAPCPVLVVGQPAAADFRDYGPKRILIAVDGSDQAGGAAALGTRLAEAFSARVILVHVIPDVAEFPPTYGIAPQESLQAKVRSCGEAFLAKFLLHGEKDLAVERVLYEGSVAAQITTAARDNEADLIVIGTHGRRGLGRLLLGSTAETVLRHAHCPVLCVKQ